MARINRSKRKPADAIDEYEKAVRINPRLGPAYKELGELLAEQGKNAEAIEQLNAYLATLGPSEKKEAARIKKSIQELQNDERK